MADANTSLSSHVLFFLLAFFIFFIFQLHFITLFPSFLFTNHYLFTTTTLSYTTSCSSFSSLPYTVTITFYILIKFIVLQLSVSFFVPTSPPYITIQFHGITIINFSLVVFVSFYFSFLNIIPSLYVLIGVLTLFISVFVSLQIPVQNYYQTLPHTTTVTPSCFLFLN